MNSTITTQVCYCPGGSVKNNDQLFYNSVNLQNQRTRILS